MAEDFPFRPSAAKLLGMPDRASIPPLPKDWPFTPRAAGRPLERSYLSFDGSPWHFCSLGPLNLEGTERQLSSAFGRGGIRRLGDLVVRPYRRGGMVRHINERIYASELRFAHEHAVHLALWSSGFPTVEPVGYAYCRRLWGFEGLYLTRYTEAVAWPNRWDRSDEVLAQLPKMLDALAAWGLHAPDLNATNILLDGDGQILALDWDRARWMTAENLRGRYEERLLRSLGKLGAPAKVLDRFRR